MVKKKGVVFGICFILVIVICLLCWFYFKSNSSVKEGDTIELMDLYCEIVPYDGMSYGYSYISEELFDSLFRFEDYKIIEGLGKDYSVNGNIITFSLNNSTFKTPEGEINVTAEYIVQYFDKLIRLAESNMLSNPGILNIQNVTEDNGDIKIEFVTEKPYNVLALAEKIGYEHNAKWYGTKCEIEYLEGSVALIKNNVRTIYVTSATESGLKNDMRIANMVLSNVLKDDTVNTEIKLNDSYGFLTWGEKGVDKFGLETRKLIFKVLENVGIRDNVTNGVDSIYSKTGLYKNLSVDNKATPEALSKAGLSVKESLKIGVVNMGSFDEVSNSINQAFIKANIPAYVEKAELTDLVGGSEYDLIYVRLERGLSPDISGLLSENGFLGKLGYHEIYKNDLLEINNAKTWDEMCSLLSELEYKMRDDGVWLFIDRGFDIVTTKK